MENYPSDKTIDALALARELIELMRTETNLSYEHCQSSLETVVGKLRSSLNLTDLDPVVNCLNQDILDISNCEDLRRIRNVIETLTSFKEDSQQRSWSLHEDLDAILNSLSELKELLSLADPRVSLRAFDEDGYEGLLNVVQLHQMETRLSVRVGCVETLKQACTLAPAVVAALLPSVLPVELARELISVSPNQERDVGSLELLVLLFSTGEPLPFSHYDMLNSDFLEFLLGMVEAESRTESELHAAVLVVLAFNLHFSVREENLVLQTLLRLDSTKHFSERILLLLNKQSEPIWPYPTRQSPYPSSVVKLLQDIFCDGESVDRLFYSNDAAVLLDVVLRGVADFNPCPLRTEYLRLLELLVKQTALGLERPQELEDCLQLLRVNDVGLYPTEDYKLIGRLSASLPASYNQE